MQIVWITVGVLLTLFLALLTAGYLVFVIGLWCPRSEYDN
jgi:hypothetical protein